MYFPQIIEQGAWKSEKFPTFLFPKGGLGVWEKFPNKTGLFEYVISVRIKTNNI